MTASTVTTVNGYGLLLWLTTSFIGFYTLHNVLQLILSKKCKTLSKIQVHQIATKLVSGTQAIIVSCVSVRTMVTCTDIMYGTDIVLDTYIYAGSAYFIYDIIVMYQGYVLSNQLEGYIYTKKNVLEFLRNDTLIVIHHVVLEFVCFPVVLFLRKGLGSFFIAGFFFAEVSTPFYSLRNILKLIGRDKSFVYVINGILFMLTFFIGRVCMVPYLYYSYATYKNISLASVPMVIPLHCNLFSLLFEILQAYWFCLVVRSVLHYVIKYNVNQHQKIEMNTNENTNNNKNH